MFIGRLDPNPCLTVDNIPCALPFIYKGRAHAYCTPDGDFDERPWCSTR